MSSQPPTPELKAPGDVQAYEQLRRFFDFFEARALRYYAEGKDDVEKQGRARQIAIHIQHTIAELNGEESAREADCTPPLCWDGTNCVPCSELLKKLLRNMP